jgi:hypothetical protein
MRTTALHPGSVRAALSLVLSFVLTAVILPLTAPPASAEGFDAELSIEAYVTGHQGEVPTISPGSSFSYTVNLQCSAEKCQNGTVAATLPAPLTYDAESAITVSPAIADTSISGRDLTVTFRDGGLAAGQVVMITVKAKLPKGASADDDGESPAMTFTAKADNADTVSDAASVLLAIDPVLAAKATKSVKPASTQPAVAGRDVTFTIGGANTSNVSVDSLVLADPSDVSGSNPFSTLALTGITTLTGPTGANRVALSWYDGTDWHHGDAVAIPSEASDLLHGIDLATVKGVTFTFSKDGGSLPPGDPASVVLATTSRDGAFDGLDQGDQLDVVNKTSATVRRGSDSASDTAQASVSFEKRAVQVDVTKAFDGSTLVAGKSTTVTLEAKTGVMPASTIRIDEPAAGEPSLADQGLQFGSFVTDSNADAQLTWPDGATSASITYTYTDGTSETLTSTRAHTLPAPSGTVAGFSVTFSSDDDGMAPHAQVVIPFTVVAQAVRDEAGTTVTNTVKATATDDSGSASDTASDDLTLLPRRVRTSVEKSFNRSWVWASAGSAATIELTGKVAADSTVGSDHLTLTDDDATFWDHFDLRRILSTDVPSNAVLTVRYYDGTDWQQLTDPVTGPKDGWSLRLTSEQSAAVQGIRFIFTPKNDGDLLPAGFTVVPHLEVALRQALRSDGTISATTGTEKLTNAVSSEVANGSAIISPVADESSADLVLRPIGGSGGAGGVDLVEKYWLDPETGARDTNASISALSDEERTAAVGWGTDGLSMSSVEVVDDPHVDAIANSLYNAFDLVRIQPITTAIDPSIGKDRVAKVELYLDGSGWTDIAPTVCPGSTCDGTFPGYTLSAAERQSTLAARLTFEPGSASATDAVATSGKAFDRQVRFDFRIRRTLRSDSSAYVLGTSHPYTYNSGDRGVVLNHAEVTGTLTQPLEDGTPRIRSTDSDDITIYDRPLNVSFTKTLDQTALGIPQNTSDTYPLVSATLKATNNTASGIPEIDITDPANSSPILSWYRYFNLYQIELGELPEGLTAEDVTVVLTLLDSDGHVSTETRTYAQAHAMSPSDLAGVVGVRVAYGAADNLADASKPLIPSDATATVVLTYQLRATLRNDDGSHPDPMVEASRVTNTARTTVVSAGGIGCTGDADGDECDAPTATDSAHVDIDQPTYTVTAGKTISPSTRYEDQSTSYTVALTGQPTGTARTRTLTLTDATPTFWNAFDLGTPPTVTLPAPLNQLQMSVLTGVQYSLVDGSLVASCAGDTDLAACWHADDWRDAGANNQVTPSLPAGINADQVRGVRFEVRRLVGGTAVQWERPADPVVTVRFAATRRSLLVYGTNGATDTPVPSTLPGMATAPGERDQGVTTDGVEVDGLAAWRTQEDNAYTAAAADTDTTTLLHRVNRIKVEKTPAQGTGDEAPRYDLDATIPYQLKITNTGAWAMTGLTIADQVALVGGSSPLVAADADPVFRFTVDGSDVSGFTGSLDTATGAISITVPSGFVLGAGQVLAVKVSLRFRDRLPAGTSVANTVTVGAARDFETCESTQDGVAQTTTTSLVPTCSSSTTVVAAASTPITVSKAVKGKAAGDPDAAEGDVNYDDLGVISVGSADASACDTADADGFYAPPCAPITRPGGAETWRLSLANNGNVAANVVSAIDVLPAPGDTGVIVSTARKSRFATTFLGNMKVTGLDGAAPHKLTYYYSTTAPSATCNKADILNDTRPDGQGNCGTTWIRFTNATDADVLATAKAIKVLLSFDDAGDGLEPGSPFSITFDTRTPSSAPVADATTVEPIAWNSVAVGSRTADTGTFPARASLVTEPRKVGVALASGEIDLSKTVVAPGGAAWLSYLPSTYAASLSCTSLGDKVALRNSAGADVSGVTLAADGPLVAYNGTHLVNLPLFSTCSLSETAGQGATATFDPASTIALRDYSGVANIAHGWGSGSTTSALNVTNTYRAAGFTVTKTVPEWPARYADGSAVVFKDFAYTASCTFLGHEVVPEADRAFTLRADGSKQFRDLPAGAECVVRETYAAGADATTVTTTQGGTTVDSGKTGTSFTLVPGAADATAVAYTNTYAAGSAVITKSLTGAGADAWGDQDFEVQLVCTHADANPAEVYRATKTLSKATSLTWTVDHLAAGAQCAVTETAAGGATSTTITGGSFAVDAKTPAQVGVTNRFGTGSVTVTKQVQANGAATAASPWADGTFPVTLTCTRPVNGSPLAVTIPGATRNLTKAGSWTATWTGLPTNATCSIAEDVANITGVTGQPDPTVTVAPASLFVGDGTTVAATVTNNYRAGKLKITKTLFGAGASFFTGATFSVACTLGGTSVLSRTGISVPAGTLTSAEIGPIPFGADCTVTETNSGGADVTPAPQTVTVSANDATSDVTTVNVTNTFSAGTLTITKALAGDAAGKAWATGGTFVVAVSCGTTSTASFTQNVTIKGAGSTTLMNGANPRLFPVGTHCWASETTKGGATKSVVSHPSFDDGVVVTAQSDPAVVQAMGITATNTYSYAGLTVSKTVDGTTLAKDQAGNSLAYPTSVAFRARCTFNNSTATSTVLDNSFTITGSGDGAWGSRTFDKLPSGASCTVTETTPAMSPTITYAVTRTGQTPTNGTATSASVTLVTGGPGDNAAAFTNTFSVGNLVVRKAVSPANSVWASAPFTVTVECTVDYPNAGTSAYSQTYTFSTSSGSYPVASIPNLPTGASCTTTETKTGGASTTTYANQTGTIAKGDTLTTTVTNTFQTGSVRVAKVLKVNGATSTAEPWASASYTMTLSCTRSVNGVTESVDLAQAGGATKVLNKANGYAYTWTGLPRNATCTATESSIDYPAGTPSQPAPTVTYSPTQATGVTVGDDTTVTQTVTNDFGFGTVQIVKALAGDAAATWGTGTFTFSVSCTLDGTTGTVFSQSGITLSKATGLTSAAIGPVPQGAICTVTETGTAGATSVTPASKVVVLDAIEAGSTRTASFTNTFDHAGFTVTKTVSNGGAVDQDGNGITYAATYHFSATCSFNGNTVLSVPDITLLDGGSRAFESLPVGASCAVTETGTGNAHPSSVITQNGTAGPVTDGTTSATFTLVAGQSPLDGPSPAATVVGFTDTYTVGGLDITKVVTGSGADAWGSGPFAVRLVCTLDHDANSTTAAVTVYDRTHSLVGGETWSVPKLPTAARCTVTETASAGANETTIDVPTPTITTAVQTVTVTNTFNTGSVRVTKAIAGGLGTLAPWKDTTYEFTLACTKDFDGDGTAESFPVPNAAKTVTGPGSVTWTGLPQDASCAATETGIAYPEDTPDQPDATVTSTGAVTVGSGTTGSQTLTNTFATAKVNIAKTIAGTAATTWGTGPFVFSVTCTLTGSGTVFGPTTVTLTPATGQTSLTSADLGPIPQGSTCTVAETDWAGAVPVQPSSKTVTLTSVQAGRTTTAAFTNTFDFAGFTVSKATASDAVDADGTPIAFDAASFTASCLFRGAEVLTSPSDRSFTLAGGADKTFVGLPTGARCTVTETGTAGAARTDVVVTQGASTATGTTSATFTLAAGGVDATSVAFTNHYPVGTLRITKTVTGPGADLWGGGDFTVAVTCTLAAANPNQVFSRTATVSKAHPVWTIPNLPTGADCAVTETKAGGANGTSITNGSPAIGNATTVETGITNTFTLGAVRVTKALTVNGVATSAKPWTQGSYTVTLACTRDVDGTAEAIRIPDGPDRTITGAGSATYADLPTGASCTVAETGSSPAAQTTTVTPSGTVTVGADPDAPQAFTVTNDFYTATMSVLKQLEGVGQAGFGDGPFTFDVRCRLDGAADPVYTHEVTLTRPAGSTVTSLREDGLGPVPVGAVCLVTEFEPGGADATPSPVTLTIGEDDASNVATFTNQFSAGTVWLTKTLAGAAKDEAWATGASFSAMVTCQVEGEGEGVRDTVLSREVTIQGGQRLNVTDADGHPSHLPLGTRCWISEETDTQGATSTSAAQHDWDSAAVVTTGTPEAVQALELGLTNTYEYAGFTVAKAVDNGGAVDANGTPIAYPATFGFDARCTFNGATVLDETFSLLGGDSRGFTGLPSGADCTVTESGTGNAASTSVKVTQDGTTGAAQDSASTRFTLVRGSGWDPAGATVTTAAFTNHFTTGAISITKHLSGAGADAWGSTQGFTVTLRCTLDTDNDPATPAAVVFEGSHDLSEATGMNWTVGNLATGASCEVGETAHGGANDTTITNPSPTVGDDPATPVQVGVTNEFTTGSVVLTKRVQVDGEDSDAEPYASAAFQVRLSCARLVNGIWTVVDIPGDSHPAGNDLDGVRTIIGSGAARYDGLPTGAACRVSEQDAAFPLPADQVDIDAPELTVEADTDVSATIANDYRTGTLQLAKQLVGAGVPDWSDGDFTFAVTCTLTDTGGTAHEVFARSGIVLNQADGLTSEVFAGVPVGADCTVTETSAGGSDAPEPAPVGVTIVDGRPNVATLTNEFNLGGVLVTLGLTLDGTPTTADPYAGGRYAVELTCTREVNGAQETVAVPGGGTWTFTGPGSHLFSGLPVGARCAVRQTSASLAPHDVTYAPGAPGSTSGPVTITADHDDPSTLGVVNNFVTSTLVVTKQLRGDGAGTHARFPFAFRVSCTLAETGVATPHAVFDTTLELSVAAGLVSAPLGPIPVGADCVVTETGSGGATVAADPAEVTIAEGGSTATLANTFDVGSVVVAKAITVDGTPSDADPYASGRYTVTLACTALVDGVAQPVTVPGGASRTITGAGSVEYAGLPLGASCGVTETGSSLAIPSDQVTISADRVTVGEQPAKVTITNDFRTGALVLNWAVRGVGTQFAGPATFSVDCTLDGATGWAFHQEVTLDPSDVQGLRALDASTVASATFAPIPVGARCSVTQTDAKGADRLSDIVVATGAVTLQAEVVNEYSAGTLTITKQLKGADASSHTGSRFDFTVTCQAGDGSTSYTGVVSIVGAGSTTLSDAAGQPLLFPAGTSCWAQESGTGGADSHEVDHDSPQTALSVVAGQPDAVQQLVVTAVNTFADPDAVASDDDDDLAYTGFGGTGLAVLGLAFVAAGAWLVRRRRA